MRKKANEEAMLEQRSKAKEEALKNEALEFYRQLKEHGLAPFDGASIHFHRRRGPVVFIPPKPMVTAVRHGEGPLGFLQVFVKNPLITTVKKEELTDFLLKYGVRRVLIDALSPSYLPLLQSLLEEGMQVYVLRRPTALSRFKAMVQRRYKDVQIPQKNIFVDAVALALAFTSPRSHRRIDLRFLKLKGVEK
jgi:hypothetical protein